MHSTKFLLAVTALAGASLSQKSDAEFCSMAFASMISQFGEAPTTPADVLSYISASATPTGPRQTTFDFQRHASELCSIGSVLPSSLKPEFQSFAQDLLQYGRDHESEIVAYITNCEPQNEVASMTSALDSYFTATGNPCPATPAPGASSNGTYPTTPAATATSSPSFNGTSTTSFVIAAAARPTGALLGAAAGVLGAAAML
ncbi:hypothetical protein RRF57_004058 [Xylaria bambusicola]|uniref:Uncharacterized protein n=1 Tax=Xylaria bambusicola TaxID=326684 RepID=A0AAN7Z662_9PEZI